MDPNATHKVQPTAYTHAKVQAPQQVQVVVSGAGTCSCSWGKITKNSEADETSNLNVQVPGILHAVLKHGNALFTCPCTLLTGDKQHVIESLTLRSCTIKMLSLEKQCEVVVINEIQMIADS